MAEKKQSGCFIATGRRKKSIARVRLYAGSGKFEKQPLTLTSTAEKFDVVVNVEGGGISGQAGAICHGIARALLKVSETYRKELKDAGFLTRDPRMKERKKYGLKKARKASQFSKR